MLDCIELATLRLEPIPLSATTRLFLIGELGRQRRLLLSPPTLPPFRYSEIQTRPTTLHPVHGTLAPVMALRPGNLNGNVHAAAMISGADIVKGVFVPASVMYCINKERKPGRGLATARLPLPVLTY